MKKFGRLLTAMVTPFDENGAIDYAQAKKLARALLDSGSEGLIVSGTTGESPVLGHDEKLRLFSEIKTAVGKRGVVIAGPGQQHAGQPGADPGGGENGRRRRPAGGALLQQAHPGGPLPAFPDHRRRHCPALHPL